MSLKIYILFFLSMFAVSTSPLIARYLDHLNPITISFWRMIIASFIIMFYSFYRSDLKPIHSQNKFKVIIAGFFLGIHFTLFYGSIALMPNNIANATVFGTMAPLFALLIEFYFGRKINTTLIIGLCIVLFGSCVMLIYDFNASSNLIMGNILAILCSICFAFVFIISDKVRDIENSIIFSKYVFIYASITLLCIGLFANIPLLNITTHDFIYLFILGLIPTIIGHSVLYYLVKYFQPTIVASIPLGEPFIASIFAWFLFPGQVLNIYIILGGMITLIGLFIIIQSKK